MTEEERIAQAKQAVAPKAPALEALEKRRAAALERQKAAAEKAAVDELTREVEAEETLAEITEQRGPHRACIVQTIGGPVVLERGPEGVFKSFRVACERSGKQPVADKDIRRFVYSCFRYPSDAEAFFSDAPAALDTCCVELSKLYGMKASEDGPK